MQIVKTVKIQKYCWLKNYYNKEITFDDWDYVFNQVAQLKTQIKKLYEEQEENTTINNNDKILSIKEHIKDIAKNPKSIIDVKDDLIHIKQSKAFFYRKFTINSNIEKYWDSIIKAHDNL